MMATHQYGVPLGGQQTHGQVSVSGASLEEASIVQSLRSLDNATEYLAKVVEGFAQKIAPVTKAPMDGKEAVVSTPKCIGSSFRMAIDEATARVNKQANKINEILGLLDF